MPSDRRNTVRTAMIVDDAFFMRNMLRSILELAGFSVIAEAADGDEAVAKYRGLRPDMTLMDIHMPVKNGIDATREIISFDRDAIVVMCSGVGQELFVMSALAAGAWDVISKPFKTEEVLEILQQVIEAKFTMKKEGIGEKA